MSAVRWLTGRVTSRREQLVLLAVCLVLAVTAALVAVRGGSEGGGEVEQRTTAQVVQRVEGLLSYQPSTVLADLDREAEFLTGDFRDEYVGQVRRSTAPDAQAGGIAADAAAVEVGVVESSAREITYLMFLNVSYTTASTAEATTRGSRVEVVARQVDGDWKIASLTPL